MNNKNNKEDKVFSFDTPDDSSGFLLWQVTSLWQREITKVLKPFNLTHAQFVLLASAFWLTQVQKDVTQANLSEHSKIDPMTTSTVLRTLEAKKLIKRREHDTDTRAKVIELTKQGKAVVKGAVVAVEAFDTHFFTPLSNHIKDFNRQLKKLSTQSGK